MADERSEVLLIGGAGFIGRVLTDQLMARGYAVRWLSRHPPASVPPGVSHRAGDFAGPGRVRASAAGCGVMVLLAAREDLPFLPRGDRHGLAMERVNVEGTRRALLEAREVGVRRAIVVTSCTTFGFTGDPLDDSDEVPTPEGKGVYAANRLAQERAALSLRGPDFEVVCAAPTVVVGAGEQKFFGPLLESLPAQLLGVPVPPGGFNFITVDDVAVALLALVRGEGRRARYLLGAHNLSWSEFLNMVAETGVIDVGPKLPRSLVRIALSVFAVWGWLLDRRFSLPEGFEVMTGSCYYDVTPAVRDLGLPCSDLRPAIEAALSAAKNVRGALR